MQRFILALLHMEFSIENKVASVLAHCRMGAGSMKPRRSHISPYLQHGIEGDLVNGSDLSGGYSL